jgi:Cu2+-exporting ATPase
MTACFHCNEPVLTGEQFTTVINGQPQPMCCPGCQAVSQAIMDAGLSSYYQFRSEPGQRQTALVPAQLSQYSAYDLPEVQQDFVHKQDAIDSTSLSIDGITCAACAWLIEHKLKSVAGITSVLVNSTTQRALVSWDSERILLSQILQIISKIGYQAAPYQVDEQEKQSKSDSRKFLLRLGLAGFATMQVMMFALALYTGYFTDLDVEFRDYFRWVSLIFAAPVVLYSAQPFYFSALRSLLSGQLNMDVSVSIAILGAYVASCIATIQGNGEVYFESVSMFTFFLLLGRYFEQTARQKASVSSSNLHKLVPLTAHLLRNGDVTIILVKPGEVIAADAEVVSGQSSVNEAMLTGEQMPISKRLSDIVYAGTINIEQPLEVCVTALGQDQLVAEIIRLQELASNNKPAIALVADRFARYFTGTILSIAALTYLAWLAISPDDAFWITLSVLVATCPCALALATPTAVTCATAIFTKLGVIPRKPGIFEKLTKIDHVVFDKTGTLTCGHLSIGEIHTFGGYSSEQVLALAAAIEQGSLHPIAIAFSSYYDKQYTVENVEHHIGLGISATVNQQRICIGTSQFVTPDARVVSPQAIESQWIYLAIDNQLMAKIEMLDQLRVDSLSTVNALKAANIKLSIASGDHSGHVEFLANKLGISDVHSGLSPQGKLELINQLQQQSQVAMFGDGINDAPVLAGANLSVAMGSGSAIAKNSADLILLGDHLLRFNDAIGVAKKTQRIIHQNLLWAFAYNMVILPLAVTGHVAPYIAAIGMSVSSLIVVSNSLRLLRIKL